MSTEANKPPPSADEKKKKLEAEEQNLENQIEEVGKITPPDGGYGWVVVIASFLVNMAVDGVIYTCGKVLIPAWTARFETTSAAGTAISLLTGCYYLCGPLASALVNVFGIRSVAIGGSMLSTTAFLLSFHFHGRWEIYGLFGVLGGIGFGCMYLPSIVILSTYFSKRRSLATGIAVCGSGIGTVVFSQLADPVWKYVVGESPEKFMLYLAGIASSGALFSLFFAPLTASDAQVEKVASIVKKYEGTGNEEATRELLEAVRNDLEELNRPEHKEDVFYPCNSSIKRSRSNTMDHKDAAEAHRSSSHVVHVTEQHTVEHIVKKGNLELIKDSLCSIWDTELLLSPSFMTLAVSGTLTVMSFLVPFVYLSEAMLPKGFNDFERALPLTLIGVFNIICRILCGYAADHPKLSALQVSNIATIIAGTSMMFVPFCTELWHYIVFTIPFSAGVACFAALRSVICVELIGVDKLSNAFGILMVFMGIGATIGGPIAATIKDITTNYDYSFYVMGVVFAFSGIMTIRLPQIKAWEDARRARATETELRVISS